MTDALLFVKDPVEYGEWLADQAPELTPAQVEQAARILAPLADAPPR